MDVQCMLAVCHSATTNVDLHSGSSIEMSCAVQSTSIKAGDKNRRDTIHYPVRYVPYWKLIGLLPCLYMCVGNTDQRMFML